jgi:uncharacterized membrane protein YagU involved in acid resistance
MKIGKIVLYGFLLWLTAFVGAFIVFPLKQSNPPLFETLVAVVLAAATVLYGRLYFRREEITLKYCIIVGFIWALINIIIDLPLFSYGPMKKDLADYMSDIGLTYLMIPIILSAFAFRRD